MDNQPMGPDAHERPHHSPPFAHGGPAFHPHHVKPIDSGFRLVVRTVLWVIAGALIIGLGIWWVST